MAGEPLTFLHAAAIAAEPPPAPPQVDAENSGRLPDGLRGASFEELAALMSREHAREVGAYKAELQHLQEKNAMLSMRLRSQQDGAAHGSTEPPCDVPRLSSEEGGDGSGGGTSPTLAAARGPATESDHEVSTPIAAWGPHRGSPLGAAVEHKTSGDSSGQGNLFNFPPKVAWSKELHAESCFTSANGAASFSIAKTMLQLEGPHPPIQESREKQRGCIGTPTQPHRLAWDITGAILIFFDLFRLPMDLAFSPPKSSWTSFGLYMDWFIMIFWTLNVPASLTVGHMEHGVIVMDPRRILIKYFKTWFVVDLLVVVPDWIFTIAALAQAEKGEGKNAGSAKLVKVLRLVRMVRLLRLLKLRRIFATFSDMINSEYASVVANIVKMMLVLVVSNHLIGCVWFAIAQNMQDEPGTTWIKYHEFDDVHWMYQYTSSFHWSITQFTPASMHIQPQNVTERTFAIVVVIFALVGFSYIVGSITGSLAQLRNMYAEESKLFWDLRRYLVQNKVTERNPTLSFRIQKYLEHAWKSQLESKPVKDVKLMQLLSEQLSSELKYELAVHRLNFHPFLAQLCVFSSVTVHRLSNSALEHKLLAEGDHAFLPGEVATHMYIVVKGKFRYTRLTSKGQAVVERVDNGEDWVAEPALWTESWLHRGLLTAVEESDNLMIDARKFCDQIMLNPEAHLFTCGYAKNYLDWLNDASLDELSDVSQGEDIGDLCRSFIPTDIYEDTAPDPTGSSSTRQSTTRLNTSFQRLRTSFQTMML